MLQQYLPFTVLKRYSAERERYTQELQQYLPFTVLKRMDGKAGLIAELK